MDELKYISQGFRELTGITESEIIQLPRSGSDRKYFRIKFGSNSVIGAFNPLLEENETFIGFTKHFLSIGLPVPEILGYFPDRHIYFLTDLGDVNLYTWLHNKDKDASFDNETLNLYRKILDNLITFQIKGIKGLNLELCFPHKSFDRQSMMWDLNYFKYMFLKLMTVPFNERKLENDFTTFCDFLLAAGQDYFLYRDFQTANIMVVNGEPWFIDFQGGRKGAPQYDVASLLYDAKISMTSAHREELLEYYIDKFCSQSGIGKEEFRGYYTAFSMIRVMQALGAFGFRGLYEQKPTFTESIVPGVHILEEIIRKAESHIHVPELYKAIRSVFSTVKFIELSSKSSIR
jgi:aminoglycoside/choline kinase family phosphotransferase